MAHHRVGQGFKSIVVGTDGSASAVEGVRQAAMLARASKAVLHIVGAYRGDAEGRAAAILCQAAEDVQEAGVEIRLHAVESEPARAICWVADRHDADLIVVGDERTAHGLRRLHRSVSEKLELHAPCPVLSVDTMHGWSPASP